MYTTLLIASLALVSATADWARQGSVVRVANDSAECCSTVCCDASACPSAACCDDECDEACN